MVKFLYVLSVLLFLGISCPKKSSDRSPKEIMEGLRLPDGYSIDLFAEGVEGARMMCRGDQGTLFVGTMKPGVVYALPDRDGDFKADEIISIGSDLFLPNGVAFKDGDLYVAEVNKVWRYPNIESSLPTIPEPVLISDKLPSESHHGWKFIRFGPDGKLYVPIGAPCNICESEDERFASICRMNPDGTGFEIFAKGVRNTVGFDWNPETGDLYFGDNGRDWMGNDMPPCELNRAGEAGMHFGYPYCHGGDIADPKFGEKFPCSDFVPPTQKLGPHVAPVGMRFADKNRVLLCEHGSWNRDNKIGYRVVQITLDENGEAIDYNAFIDGWLENEEVFGRPSDVEILNDGSIFISDDMNGLIYHLNKDE